MKQISYDTYLKALALFVMAAEKYQEAQAFQIALGNTLGYPKDETYFGFLSDVTYDTPSIRAFEEALRKEGFEVASSPLSPEGTNRG
jgi:hypothetical protein